MAELPQLEKQIEEAEAKTMKDGSDDSLSTRECNRRRNS